MSKVQNSQGNSNSLNALNTAKAALNGFEHLPTQPTAQPTAVNPTAAKSEPQATVQGEWRKKYSIWDIEIPPLDPILNLNGGILHRRAMYVIAAVRKGGKTTFSIEKTKSIVSGKGWCTRFNEHEQITILHVDTEQDASLTKLQAQSVMDCNFTNTVYEVVTLQGCLQNERLSVLKQILVDVRPDILIIDNVLDLLPEQFSFNDLQPCQRIVNYLLNTTVELNCCTFLISHLSGKSQHTAVSEAKGHLGSALAAKASGTFLLKQGTVYPECFRMAQHAPQPFQFANCFKTVETVETVYFKLNPTQDAPPFESFRAFSKHVQSTLNISQSKAKARIDEFEAAGYVKKEPNGQAFIYRFNRFKTV